MIKNTLLLCTLVWFSYSYAKHPVAQENMGDAEFYKVEKPTPEQKAKRSLAGGKFKKNKKSENQKVDEEPSSTEETDSEVRYWQYSE